MPAHLELNETPNNPMKLTITLPRLRLGRVLAAYRKAVGRTDLVGRRINAWNIRRGAAFHGVNLDHPSRRRHGTHRSTYARLELTTDEGEVLRRYVRRGTTSQRLSQRARIILECAKGQSNDEVAVTLGINAKTVGKWRARFVVERLDGLVDAPRPGAPRQIGDDKVEEVIVATLETMPKGASRWSTRDMAKNVGISRDSVARIWRAFGLKPHRSETFQLSTDPDFIDKVRDVVGLYMDPPNNTVILSVDEKTQIQALNRTQPLLPLRPGRCERRTPEYQRNGTSTLFAALDVATGSVIGKCFPRHRAAEFVKLLAKHPRFHLHFVPTHSSWLNQVEGWFSILTEKQFKRGSHHSVRELEAAIHEFLDAHNESPKPFAWVKTADEILAKVARYCAETVETHATRT